VDCWYAKVDDDTTAPLQLLLFWPLSWPPDIPSRLHVGATAI
jgi:hypothetical protein